ncbi:penicillin-binding transpeptidase domain-containing protein [Neobacillus niacini]|uniref:penicillin-binding transpeptidase domain-containing protein n=1 Tax=Neobacillus niacini TaxID=86668 RepID=UPI0021CB4280|nr:penicillin-binding transpeptidase domain-containing protein [Neobacillus niacini]MCM3763974.1 penicillin-binding transpeptidase domain-containing protein [Neobacillus niacini]
MSRGLKVWLLFLVVLGAGLTAAGCSKEPTPQERFAEYISLWNDGKFDKMYGYLSNDAKKDISQEEFTSRYEKIYDDLQITDLKIDFKKPKEDKQADQEQAKYTYTAKMSSIAGPITFTQDATLKKQDKDDKANWYVDWNPGFIFPGMQEGDTISLSTVPAKRGEILDRNGSGVAVNGQVYEVGVSAPDAGATLAAPVMEQLSALLKMPRESIEKALSAGWVKPGMFVPLKKVSMDDQERIAQLVALESVKTRKVDARIYPYRESAAHLIGYVGPITADELEKLKDKGYTSKDVIGKRGLEQVLDQQLKGESGVKIFIKKKVGGEKVIAEKPVSDGKDVKLTIDADLQSVIFDEMSGGSRASGGVVATAGEVGTAAALNPTTGETLALVSSPSFDPNQAMLGYSADERKSVQEDARQPLLTRFKMTYAPGSVLKPVTAAVALGNGAIKPEEAVEIQGPKWQKDASWGGYFVTRVHEGSPINLEKAFVSSDNIYFAQAALKTGKEKFAAGLKQFGFEEKPEYAYPLETSKIGDLGRDIALADSGYGQGQVEMSIVHLLSAYTPFVNGSGDMMKPILLAEEESGQVLKKAVVSAENAGLIAGYLRKVVSDPGGTAHVAEMANMALAGKTGTAEIKQKQGETGTENGWFVAWNADGSPNLLVAMMVEGVQDRGGSKVPVTMVKDIFMKLK